MNEKKIIAGVVILLSAVGVILYATSATPSSQTKTDATVTTEGSNGAVGSGPNLALAQCLKDKGVTFYGAFWCPHCKTQKALFGDAAPALPYVECSTPDGNSQTDICKEKKIESYPTWEFTDGSRMSGEQTFAQLAEKSGCTNLSGTPSDSTDSSAK